MVHLSQFSREIQQRKIYTIGIGSLGIMEAEMSHHLLSANQRTGRTGDIIQSSYDGLRTEVGVVVW